MFCPAKLATTALVIGATLLPLCAARPVPAAPAPASAKKPPAGVPAGGAERKLRDFVGRADQRRERGLYTFQSGAYRITTDVDKDLANDIAAHMDAVYLEYDARLRGFQDNPFAAVKPGQPMPLYVLRTYKDYLTLLDGFGVNGANSGGVFFRTANKQSGLATWVQGQSRLKMYYILQHEGFHQFADARIMFGLPPWANEGLAEYFGDAVLIDRKLVTGKLDRERIERMRTAVRNGDTLPFATLMNMTNEAWLGRVNAGDKGASLMYDTAWSVCYFLIHGGPGGAPLRTTVRGTKGVGALEAYLRILNDSYVRNPNGDPGPAAFKEVFSNNLKAFEAAWKQGLQKLEPDAWFTSVRHAQFIAAGVRFCHENDVEMTSWEGLKSALAVRRFTTTIRERDAAGKGRGKGDGNAGAGDGDGKKPGAKAAQKYEFPEPTVVEFVPSDDPKLPPGLLMTQVTPNIRLSWTRNAAGEVEEVITFPDPPRVAKAPPGATRRRADTTSAKPALPPRAGGEKSNP